MTSFFFCYIFSILFSPLDKCVCRRTLVVCISHTNRTKIPRRYHARPFRFGKTQSLPNSWNLQDPVGGQLCVFRQGSRHRNFYSVIRIGTTCTFWSPYCIKNIVEIKKTQKSASVMTPAIKELSFSQNTNNEKRRGPGQIRHQKEEAE